MVCVGQDDQSVTVHEVDDANGEALHLLDPNVRPAIPSWIGAPGVRKPDDRLDRGIDSVEKVETKSGVFPLVEARLLQKLLMGLDALVAR